jgi:glycosyltransferase involved in cell wall biosynthesis
LATSLVEAGHTVLVAGPQATLDSLDLAGTGVLTYPVRIGKSPRPIADRVAVETIRRIAQGADVVHAHGLRAGGLAAIGRRRAGPPLVVTLHNALLVGGVTAEVYAVLERLVARRAAAVLAVSPDLEQRQRLLGARDVEAAVVPAPPAAEPRRSPAQTREELGVSPETPLIVSVARLTGQKGLPLLLDATRLLRDREPRPLIVVAGDGPAKTTLQQRIVSEELPVRLLGWRDDVPELLAAADVAVSSAVWEGQPIWLQEGLRAGCALVVTDVGGTGRVVGSAAVLVPPGDALAIAQAVGSLLDDPEARARLRSAALARAAELPDRAAARGAVLAVYRRVTGTVADDC